MLPVFRRHAVRIQSRLHSPRRLGERLDFFNKQIAERFQPPNLPLKGPQHEAPLLDKPVVLSQLGVEFVKLLAAILIAWCALWPITLRWAELDRMDRVRLIQQADQQ